jgi:hypothetical protein
MQDALLAEVKTATAVLESGMKVRQVALMYSWLS